jgi:hypothetical protein
MSSASEQWKAIQRAVGVAADGVPGPATAKAVAARLGVNAPVEARVVTGLGRNITRIFIHCTATREGQDIDAATIRKWHKDKGWRDIGYHFVIRLDGTIEKGRDEEAPGAHVDGFNTGSIGVVYVGGIDTQGKPKDTRTAAQMTAMEQLVRALVAAYPRAEVLGHRDISPDRNGNGKVEPSEWLKACPCFDARAWWAKVRA